MPGGLEKRQSVRVWVRERVLLRWELQFLAHCYTEASCVCDSCLARLRQWECEGTNTKLWALLKHKSLHPRPNFLHFPFLILRQAGLKRSRVGEHHRGWDVISITHWSTQLEDSLLICLKN